MRVEHSIRVSASLSALCALCASFLILIMFSEPALSQAGPSAREQPLRQAQAPNAPVLISPAAEAVINAATGVPTQIFTWDPPASGPTVAFYRMTFENADNPAAFTSPIIRVEARAGRISTQQIIPPPLANARIRWSVRACNNDQTLSRVGSQPGNCGAPASRILAWSTAVGAPQLASPSQNAFAPPNAQFAWRAVQGANAYLFCISRPGAACPTSEISNANTLVVRRIGNSNTAAAPDTSRFLGQEMHWTAAACGASGQCVYQQNVRSVRVGGAPPALSAPASGISTRSLVRFEWAPASWASFYVLCVSAPGVACPNPTQYTQAQLFEGSGRQLVLDNASRPARAASNKDSHLYGSQEPRLYADLRPLEGAYDWTVAACALGAGATWQSRPIYCVYQQSVRGIRTQPLWNVRARVTHIVAHDDCDNISDGDWNMTLFVTAPSDEEGVRWPRGRGSRDIGNGGMLDTSIFHDLLTTTASGLADNETATVTLVGLDCDSDNLWELSSVFGNATDVVRDWQFVCGGEEAYEVSGGNDFLGEVSQQVRLRDHLAMGWFEETMALRSARSDCGDQRGAFTATMIISGSRH